MPASKPHLAVVPAPLRAPDRAAAHGSQPRARRASQVATRVAPAADPPRMPFAFVESKVAVPPVPPESVSRVALVNRLRSADGASVAIVAAPAGYGKTTLLAQWAARDGRPFAWVSIDEHDNDPLLLLRHVAVALDRIEPVDPRVPAALRSRGRSLWTTAIPRLASAVGSLGRPFVLVLDGADLVRSKESADVITLLLDQVPAGSMLVLASRASPPIAVSRLRARGRLLEIGAEMLALSRREAQLLVRATGTELTDDQVQQLVDQTEGWAAGLYLAALSVRRTPRGDGDVAVGGDDQYLAEYLRAEHLRDLTPELLTFLRRSSVLGKMSGPLCDAVLATTGSGARLRSIDRSNLFLARLDSSGEWCRYHSLFRDVLLRDLEDREAERIPVLNRRAADWFEAHGDREAALAHAAASGDADRTARILAAIALPAYHDGRVSVVEGWLRQFPERAHLDRYPAVAVLEGWIHTVRGRPDDARRCLEMAERGADAGEMPDGSASAAPWIAVLRAAICGGGAERMLADAEEALAGLPVDSQWHSLALVLQGTACVLVGDEQRGDVILAEAAEEAQRIGAACTRVLAIGERAILAEARGDHTAADELALEGRDLVRERHLEGYVTSGVELAASARTRLRHGRWEQARSDLSSAQDVSRSLSDGLPWFAAQTRLELARTMVSLRDADGAHAMLSEVEQILHRSAGMGTLARQADAVRGEIEAMPEAQSGAWSGLTAAELRLLPFLPTHLSFREIGERLFVSRNTIKTQAISVYRKLGVSSRSSAIARAAELGLVDVSTPPSDGFTLSG
jgi:LuxR family transcriptional regulator, maltose regulon positive regulatory protein